ncbi:energy-coupling factor transport system substrate-specific component [Agromyces hippuratus]|uniref:Energy-coupling factor transport system substrate-specific component n=1 Tax=Agromyces hippuratus TaxID=286438 RepID=A0A852WMV9_9MICO|nr:ECF transporter S component [Agromyces hippuratus]NYG19296.1 energy-coupling factor transport system substrate-specific component [Agromyces hippuratus]
MHRTSTRVILSCAAIGVGGGLFAAGAGYAAGLIAGIAPMLYGITIGSHFLPSAVALALLKRPGVGILTGFIAGLVGAAFAPHWILRFLGTGLLVGALLELPFFLTRYKNWSAWLYYVAAGASGLVLAAGTFIALGPEHYAPWFWALYLAMFALSPIAFTWLGRVIAASLARAGVARTLTTGR